MNHEKFEIFKGKSRQWYFRLKAANGKIICQSEGYTTKQGAVKGCKSVVNTAEYAIVMFV